MLYYSVYTVDIVPVWLCFITAWCANFISLSSQIKYLSSWSQKTEPAQHSQAFLYNILELMFHKTRTEGLYLKYKQESKINVHWIFIKLRLGVQTLMYMS